VVEVVAVSDAPDGTVTKRVGVSVGEAVSALVALIEGKGAKVFVVVDHGGEAARAGLELRNTKLVIFGSPVAGTPVMSEAPLAALDLPLKILVWEDDSGAVSVSYNSAGYLARRYDLTSALRTPLEVVDGITDALVAT
jgi:uncharacterized protein (DUF302 family)